MRQHPVLVIAYNRPHKLRALIQSLAQCKPRLVLFAFNGPDSQKPRDQVDVSSTRDQIELINWSCEIKTRVRNEHLPLQQSYVDAVNWVISEYGQATILEDDVVVGPDLLGYSASALERHRNSKDIGHINGYNFVPSNYLSNPTQLERMSAFPTAYAWSTWSRAWDKLDLSISWGLNASIREISTFSGSTRSAQMWKMNFRNAVNNRVQTWDYAWVSSLWSNSLFAISPNRNLLVYNGLDGGTNTRRRSNTEQVPVSSIADLHDASPTSCDVSADKWMRRSVFKDSRRGLIEKYLQSIVLAIIRRK